MAWYNSSWSHRVKITVASAEVDSTLSDFPVYVDLSDLPSGFFSNVKSDGSDIRVTTSDETTECPVEVVAINTGGSTGQIHFKAPSVSSSTNTDFYIYYGNASASAYGATDTYGRNNVWSVYTGVFHLEETSGTAVDATGGGVSGTFNGDLPNTITGIASNGQDFDGTGDYVEHGDNYDPGTGEFTWECWVKFDTISREQYLLSKGDHNTATGGIIAIRANSANTLSFVLYSGSLTLVTSTNTVSTGTWYHVVVRRGASGALDLRVNGVEWGTGTKTGSVDNTLNFLMGSRTISGADANNILTGALDEIRVLNGDATTNGWSDATYSNFATPNTFYSVGTQEDAPLPPVAAFSGTPLSGQVPQTVSFTDASTNTPTGWSWDFGDGIGTSTSQNPSYEYVNPGNYTVSLTASNAQGSDDEIKTDYVVLIEAEDTPRDPTKGKGTSEIATKYPVVEGLTLGTTKIHGRNPRLVPEVSRVPQRKWRGLR